MPFQRATSSEGGPIEPLRIEDLRMAKALAKAIDTFEGDWEGAVEWMRTPNLALDRRLPFEVALEPNGYDLVMAVLTRADHGVYS